MNAISHIDPVGQANDRARVLLGAGYKPVPVRTGDKNPTVERWPEIARSGVFQAAPGVTNVGILCDGLRVIDVDTDDQALAAKIRAMALDAFGPCSERYRENSPRRALVYRAACGEPKTITVGKTGGPKVEVLGKGRQLLSFGLHPSGVPLRWVSFENRDDLTEITEEQVAEFLKAVAPLIGCDPPASKVPSPQGAPAIAEDLQAADIDLMADIVARIPNDAAFDDRNAFVGFAHAVAAAFAEVPATGRQLFLDWACRWYRGPQAEGEAERVWESLGSDHSVGADWLLAKAQAAGIDCSAYRAEAARAAFKALGIVPVPLPKAKALCAPSGPIVGFSEDALALQFAAKYGDDLCYAVALHKWMIWDGARFQEDGRLRHMSFARDICRREAVAVPKEEDGLARKLASAQSVAATLRLAASDPTFARDIDDFDADPWLLNTPGGVVDLHDGSLRAHDAGGLFTKVTGFAPGGACPRWRRFLFEITQGDQEVIDYLQRFVGYTLTGATTEHAFIFAYGPGGNGKSILLNTIAAVLGDYAVTAMADVFTVNRNEQHPTHLATLRGARMVVVNETEEGTQWAEARLKSMTGGDRISARVMRGDPFEFKPSFKIWFAGNHRPVLKNPDEAMRRRLQLLPLTYRPPAPDTGLQAALTTEGPGILQWAIEGCLAWQRAGLKPPSAVINATADYFADQDSLSAWIAERCEATPGAKTKSADLYNDWAGWALARGLSPRGDKWFSPALEKHYSKARSAAGMQFVGIAIRPRESGGFRDLAPGGV